MSFNYSKLKGRIVEKYGSQVAFAKALGITPQMMSEKMQSKSFFSQRQIIQCMNLLDISAHELTDFFFKENVSISEQK